MLKRPALWSMLALLVIIVGAFAVRLYRFAPPPSIDRYNTDPFAQLPPGLQLDEAYNELSALRFLRTREVVPHFAIDQGIAAAHIYFTALVMLFTGPIAEAGRLASIISGLLTIMVAAWLVRELFRKKYSAGEMIGVQLLAAAQIAFTYWFVHMSRLGLELIVVPLLSVTAFAAYWHWLQHPSMKNSVLAGAALGGALYSYAAAYALPLVIGLAAISYLRSNARADRPPLKQILAYGIAFVAIILPLAIFAINRPDAFGIHLETTAAQSTSNVVDNIWPTLASISFTGDGFAAYNLPGRPLLDPIQSVFFLIGVWMCVRRIKQPEFLFLLIWCSVMLLPAIFSSWSPAFNRMAGAVAGIVLLVSIGALEFYRFWDRRNRKWLGLALILMAVAYTLLRTANDYFNVWPTTPGLLASFSTAERLQAEAIADLPDTTIAYLSPADSARPMYAYLWQDQPRAKSFNGRKCSVGPAQADRAVAWLIGSNEDKSSTDRLKALYPQLQSQLVWINNGTTIVRRLALPAGSAAVLPDQRVGSVDHLADLMSATHDAAIQPGEIFHASFLWKSTETTSENWTETVYLLNREQQVIAQEDSWPCGNSYPTSVWQPGEVISEDHKLPIPANLSSGPYMLAVSFYRLSDGTRLSTLDAHGRPIGDALPIDAIVIP